MNCDDREGSGPLPAENDHAEHQQCARDASGVAKLAVGSHQQKNSRDENDVVIDCLPGEKSYGSDCQQQTQGQPELR